LLDLVERVVSDRAGLALRTVPSDALERSESLTRSAINHPAFIPRPLPNAGVRTHTRSP
jgi:hypothetical protein